LIYFQNVSLHFGIRTILNGLSFTIQSGDRIALIGPNGAGKSTLFRLILGELPSDEGEISREKGLAIGYLPQIAGEWVFGTVWDVAMSAFSEFRRLEDELNQLHTRLSKVKDDLEIRTMMDEIGERQTFLDTHHYYSRQADVAKVLMGLGFQESHWQRPLTEFSGGWQMRAFLAKILLQPGRVLLLDEPTNHLDLPSIQWLEDYLASYEGAILIISHDRAFINRMVRSVWFLNHGRLHRFTGNYEDFVEQWSQFQEQIQKQSERIQKRAGQIEQYINRFRAKARHAANVQSKVKLLERMQAELPNQERNSLDSHQRFKLPDFSKGGSRAVAVENLKKCYGELTVFQDMEFEIQSGEKIALIGANGQGKSTLTRLLAGLEAPDNGEINFGHNVQIAYYSQESDRLLNPDNTIYDELMRDASVSRAPFVRPVLGSFLFSGDDVYKKINILSGGEKTRVAFAKFLLSDANFLILDEPTNHLDIPSKEALFMALQDYPGTILLVTHDRFFMNELVNKVFYLHHGTLVQYPGNFDDFWQTWHKEIQAGWQVRHSSSDIFRDKNKASARDTRRENAQKRQLIAEDRKKLQKQVESLESQIAALEDEQKKLELQLCDPEIHKNNETMIRFSRRYKDIPELLAQAYEEWESATNLLRELLN